MTGEHTGTTMCTKGSARRATPPRQFPQKIDPMHIACGIGTKTSATTTPMRETTKQAQKISDVHSGRGSFAGFAHADGSWRPPCSCRYSANRNEKGAMGGPPIKTASMHIKSVPMRGGGGCTRTCEHLCRAHAGLAQVRISAQ